MCSVNYSEFIFDSVDGRHRFKLVALVRTHLIAQMLKNDLMIFL
jgi:hypothetical protein